MMSRCCTITATEPPRTPSTWPAEHAAQTQPPSAHPPGRRATRASAREGRGGAFGNGGADGGQRAPGRRLAAFDTRDRIAAARPARSVAGQEPRPAGAGADGSSDRRAAAAVAHMVGAVAGGGRFSAVEIPAGVHRGRVRDARGGLRDERFRRPRSRSAGAAHCRPAAGRVTPREAVLVFVGLSLLGFVLVLLFTNRLTIYLSFAGAALAALYPFSKRYTQLPQVVLGAAFGWGIPMAFAAITDSLPPLCWLLFLGNVLFSTIYDTEYAMVDRDEDIRAGAKSTAILFGDADLPILGVLMATLLFTLLLVGQRALLDWPFQVGLLVALALFGWQLWTMRERARDRCFAAFRNNNWVGGAVWLGMVIALAIR